MDKPGDGSGGQSLPRRRSIEALDPRCRQMLEDAGFTYDQRIGAWFNLKAARAIAFDRVADMTPERLAAWLNAF